MIHQRICENVINLGRELMEDANGDIHIAMKKAFELCEKAEREKNPDPDTQRFFRELVAMALVIVKEEENKHE